jgi:hypothetical protein
VDGIEYLPPAHTIVHREQLEAAQRGMPQHTNAFRWSTAKGRFVGRQARSRWKLRIESGHE